MLHDVLQVANQGALGLFEGTFPTKRSERDDPTKRKLFSAAKTSDVTLESYSAANASSSGQQRKAGDVASSASAASQVSVDELFHKRATSVGALDPVKDFTDMLNDRTQDLVEKGLTLSVLSVFLVF